jgi:hypothetical protein
LQLVDLAEHFLAPRNALAYFARLSKKFYEMDPSLLKSVIDLVPIKQTFFVHNLQIFLMSWSICPWQAFPA